MPDTELSAVLDRETTAPAQKLSTRLREPKVIGAAVAALIVVVGAVWYFAGSGGAKATVEDKAKVACENFAKEKLAAPTSAEFTDESVTKSGTTFTVKGTVNAPNSFGVTVGTNFSCTQTQDGSTWRLTSLTGFGS